MPSEPMLFRATKTFMFTRAGCGTFLVQKGDLFNADGAQLLTIRWAAVPADYYAEQAFAGISAVPWTRPPGFTWPENRSRPWLWWSQRPT
jgi:hypothetical protein